MRFPASTARRILREVVRRMPAQRGVGRLVQGVAGLYEKPDQFVDFELTNGVHMHLDLSSYVDRYVYYTGFYRPWTLPYFDELLNHGSTVVDVGANIGAQSLWAAHQVGTAGRVLSIEPEPQSRDRLKRNVAINEFRHVSVFEGAVGCEDGDATLYVNSDDNCNHGQSSLAERRHHGGSIRVPLRRIDTLAVDYQLERVDVMKIDTQGAELHVLQGASSTVERHHPSIMFRLTELGSRAHGVSSEAAQAWLLDRKYLLFRIAPDGGEYGQPGERALQPVGCPTPVDDATFIAYKRHNA